MKKVILILLFSLFCMNLFSQQFTINEATINASQEISQRLPVGSLFAVINIESLSDDLSLHIIGLLETGLVHSERLQIVSRQRIQTVMNEQNFGMSGYVDDNTAQRIGRLLGARFVLTGEIIKPENRYFLNIQVLETETAIIMYSKSYEIRNSELRNYEQLILLKQRQERMEREKLTREEERRQKNEINRINAQERKRKWDNFINIFTPNIGFENWTPFSKDYFEIGYNYAPYFPLGLTIGTFGFYTSLNFYNTDYMNYEVAAYETYSGDEYSNAPKTYFGLQWILGYNINVLNNFLMIPIGIGGIHGEELRLYTEYSFEGDQWHEPNDWASNLLSEIGIKIVPLNHIYIQGTVRMIGFAAGWSFTLGGGAIWF